jgi:hypothetical protein
MIAQGFTFLREGATVRQLFEYGGEGHAGLLEWRVHVDLIFR